MCLLQEVQSIIVEVWTDREVAGGLGGFRLESSRRGSSRALVVVLLYKRRTVRVSLGQSREEIRPGMCMRPFGMMGICRSIDSSTLANIFVPHMLFLNQQFSKRAPCSPQELRLPHRVGVG